MKRFSPRSSSRIASEKPISARPASRASSGDLIPDSAIAARLVSIKSLTIPPIWPRISSPIRRGGATSGKRARHWSQRAAIIGTASNWSRLSSPARRPSSIS